MGKTLKDQGWRFVLRGHEFMWTHPGGLQKTDHDCTDMNDTEFFNFVMDSQQPNPEELMADKRRLDWLEKAAIARKVELAKSCMGTGFEIGKWPSLRVTVKSGSLRDAIDEAMK